MHATCNSSRAYIGLARSFRRLDTSDPLIQCLAPRARRSFASQADLPVANLANEFETRSELESLSLSTGSTHQPPNASQIITTLYSWPELEPLNYAFYNPQLLGLPLRRDILHRAVVYEADASRQGTASTKWRGDVHGSNRKIQQQKGTGRARVGDKKSPIRKGGGVAFGPHPRDFSTELQRKVYDLAWRTALSYRYRKGELLVINGHMKIPKMMGGRLLNSIFEGNKWGKDHRRSLLVTDTIATLGSKTTLDAERERVFSQMKQIGEHGLVKDIMDVDVKDLLETGRIVIEKEALDTLLVSHASDLGYKVSTDVAAMLDKTAFVHAEGRLVGLGGFGEKLQWREGLEMGQRDVLRRVMNIPVEKRI